MLVRHVLVTGHAAAAANMRVVFSRQAGCCSINRPCGKSYSVHMITVSSRIWNVESNELILIKINNGLLFYCFYYVGLYTKNIRSKTVKNKKV